MWLLLVTVATASLVLVLTRGSVRRLAGLRVVGASLLLVGLAIQAALEFIRFPRSEIENVGFALLMASYVLILTFCIANVSTKGFGIIAVGVAMNTLVIGLNRGMPTKPIGNDANGNRVYKPVEQTVKHRQASDDDLLSVLSDRILFPKPLDTTVSYGDLVISVGICELAYYGSRRQDQKVIKPTDGRDSRGRVRARSRLARRRRKQAR